MLENNRHILGVTLIKINFIILNLWEISKLKMNKINL
jgi:hypothetical protein